MYPTHSKIYVNALPTTVVPAVPSANSLDTDQHRQNIGPDLDSNSLTL